MPTEVRINILVLMILVCAASPTWAQTQQQQAEALFQEGYTLYQQRYGAVAITPLEKAANFGHAEAAYWVGEILRKRYGFISDETERFYTQAANGGEVYAMLRFGQKGKFCGTLGNCNHDQKKWLDQAKRVALPKAESGDTQAMMAVSLAYGIGGDIDEEFKWVMRAAEHGHAFAQYWLAMGLLEAQKIGSYPTEESRRADVLKWLQASAEQGFAKAIENLAVEYRKDGRYEEANVWVDRMGQTDYFTALYNYGLILMDGPEGMFKYPKVRSVDGLATLLALQRETGSTAVQRSIDRRLTDLSPEILTEAKARSEQLLIDTPILYYLPKFGI